MAGVQVAAADPIPNNHGEVVVALAVEAAVAPIQNSSGAQAPAAAVIVAVVVTIPNNSGDQVVAAVIVAAAVTIPNNSGDQAVVAVIVAAAVTIPNNSGLQAAAEAVIAAVVEVTAATAIQSSPGQVHLNLLVEDTLIQTLMEAMDIDHHGVAVLGIVTENLATATDLMDMEQILEPDSMVEWVLMEARDFPRKCLDWV